MSPPPPFRAEHIGSLLRPPALLAARRAAEEGPLSAEALRAEEDAHIREVVRLQEDVGPEVVTDGEYRRGIFFGHFSAALSGFTEMDAEMSFRGAGGEPLRYRAAVVTGRLVRLGKLHGRTGDSVKAHEHLTTAAMMYREMRMTFWLEQAKAALGPSHGESP